MKDSLTVTDEEGEEVPYFSPKFLILKYLKMSEADLELNEKYKEGNSGINLNKKKNNKKIIDLNSVENMNGTTNEENGDKNDSKSIKKKSKNKIKKDNDKVLITNFAEGADAILDAGDGGDDGDGGDTTKPTTKPDTNGRI